MSAVPKKKLCWNCEGNVARNIDNCPYCGVYLHAAEKDDENKALWSPSYVPSSKTEEIPSPLYQINPENELAEKETIKFIVKENSIPFAWVPLLTQFRQDIFPILFLMMGSVFFLFGAVLLLFSQGGTLTLQWEEKDALYFLAFAIPLIGFGWVFLQRLEND